MKKTEVKINHPYTAKIGGKLTIVRILAEHPTGGWKGRDMFTGKILHISSGRALRCHC